MTSQSTLCSGSSPALEPHLVPISYALDFSYWPHVNPGIPLVVPHRFPHDTDFLENPGQLSQRMSHMPDQVTQTMAYFCTALELRIVSIFLKGYKKEKEKEREEEVAVGELCDKGHMACET